MIELGLSLLQSGGYFVAESPNGSPSFRVNSPEYFHHLWGEVHPRRMLSEDF
jgi:hypothetical protein